MPGSYIDVEIVLQNDSPAGLGGFDLLIEFDTAALSLTDVTQGQLVTDCGWEYFSYRSDTQGVARIVSIGDVNNGTNHPDCFLANSSGPIAVLTFLVSNDPGLKNQFFPVRFYWMDCSDNAVASYSGDTLLVSRYVYDWLNHDAIHEDDVLPTYKGASDVCVTGTSPRIVDFTSGSVEIAASQTPRDISITIEEIIGAVQGGYLDVEIALQNNSSTELNGFDLLIEYDTTLMSLVNVTQGQLLTDCVWEFFTYRTVEEDLVRVVAIGDMNNGDVHPDCFLTDTEGPIAVMTFQLSGDQSLECQVFPVQFYWVDCGDNRVANITGDTVFVSRYVYDWLSHDPIQEDDEFPTYKGTPDICVTATSPRVVDFTGGWVETDCWSTDRGDLNLNGIAYEIADYVLYIQYFFFGIGVFDINMEAQIAASDANGDGQALTFLDLIYLYRVMIGDANPIPAFDMGVPRETAVFVQDTNWHTISVLYPDSLAWAFMTFSDEITLELTGGDMSLQQEGQAALVYPLTGYKTYFGEGLLLNYIGSGLFASVDAYDYEGSVPTSISIVAGPYVCGDADASGGF
ncbi:MAG: hypothetical protein KAT85_03270, partial [candidate division Zixibacteria bacterium]|nr:hypothetical protein [candidate division Zixibacteria bacterium]